MAKHPEPADVVDEIETGAERLAGWIAANPWIAGGILLAILGTAAGIGGYANWRSSREETASDALESVRAEYLREMGAPPTAIEVPELANPKAANEIRERTLEKFRELAGRERGTVAGLFALLEAADLLEALGRRDETTALYDEALASAPTPALRALALRRQAYLHEAAGRFAEAAAAFESAAAVKEYALRYYALADAARCYARAGRNSEALALYDRLPTEAPNLVLPEHQSAEIRELRAIQRP